MKGDLKTHLELLLLARMPLVVRLPSLLDLRQLVAQPSVLLQNSLFRVRRQ